MRVGWAIPCRYVEVTNGLATIVGAGSNIFWVPEFPAVVDLMMAVQILGGEEEIGHEYEIRGHVLGPDMQPVAPGMTGQFAFGESAALKPDGWEETAIVPIGMQFPAEVEGPYTWEFAIGDRSTTVSLLVQQSEDEDDDED